MSKVLGTVAMKIFIWQACIGSFATLLLRQGRPSAVFYVVYVK